MVVFVVLVWFGLVCVDVCMFVLFCSDKLWCVLLFGLSCSVLLCFVWYGIGFVSHFISCVVASLHCLTLPFL